MNVQEITKQAEQAQACGFTALAAKLNAKADLAVRLAVAYEHYRYVTAEQIAAFNAKLKASTERPVQNEDRYKARRLGIELSIYTQKVADQLVFHPMGKYEGLPPTDVFEKVAVAQGRKCFDSFEVSEISPVATQVKHPDPIVFGRIEGCTDRFYIAEWGDDVSIADLIGKNEG